MEDSGKHSLRLEDYLEILKISETDDLRIINHIDQVDLLLFVYCDEYFSFINIFSFY
jgi:hypothetical protein